jgi:hypothetical protein
MELLLGGSTSDRTGLRSAGGAGGPGAADASATVGLRVLGRDDGPAGC